MLFKKRKKQNLKLGQSLIETAIALPAFLLLVFGVMELSRAVYIRNTLHAAAQRAAESGAAASIPSLIEPNARKAAQNYIAPYNIKDVGTPLVTVTGTGNNQYVEVAMSAPLNSPVTNLIPALQDLQLTGRAIVFTATIGLAGTPLLPSNPNDPSAGGSGSGTSSGSGSSGSGSSGSGSSSSSGSGSGSSGSSGVQSEFEY